jgi:hypothetical protein
MINMAQLQQKLTINRRWALWVPARQQWLLAIVVQQKDGEVTLKFDSRYELGISDRERKIAEQDLLKTPNLFRPLPDSSPSSPA